MRGKQPVKVQLGLSIRYEWGYDVDDLEFQMRNKPWQFLNK